MYEIKHKIEERLLCHIRKEIKYIYKQVNI